MASSGRRPGEPGADPFHRVRGVGKLVLFGSPQSPAGTYFASPVLPPGCVKGDRVHEPPPSRTRNDRPGRVTVTGTAGALGTGRSGGSALSGRLVSRGRFLDLTRESLRDCGRYRGLVAIVAVCLAESGAGGSQRASGQPWRAVVRRAASTVRSADVIAQVGPGELAVLCQGLRAPAEADALKERLSLALLDPFGSGDPLFGVPGGTGAVVASAPGRTPETLLAEACAAARAAVCAGAEPVVTVMPGSGVRLAEVVVQRLFDVGLSLAAASTVLDGPGATRVRQAVDDLDDLIRDVRSVTFGPPPRSRPHP
jgi:hypothetical protein